MLMGRAATATSFGSVHTATGEFTAWHELAACRDEDPALFDGGKNTSARAKSICARCPVTAECLSEQLDWERNRLTRHAPIGVFGGKTAGERQAMLLSESRGEGKPRESNGTD
ncbi:WhiB family redox-sensing transcriptional regulator [Actinopolyspora lacussalsi]|nr:WhiB family redox-sensing transcriptional regulator [Actinopolyspora lacussalsi]